jgi:DNA-directed RNA polymerase specialized sigma24 family protein
MEDARQAVEVKLLKCGPRAIDKPEHYKRRSVGNCLCTMSRNGLRRRQAELEYARRHPESLTAAASHDPAALCEVLETAAIVRKCIAELPPRQREVIEIVCLGEVPLWQAYAQLGVSRRALQSALYHGRATLRTALGQQYIT